MDTKREIVYYKKAARKLAFQGMTKYYLLSIVPNLSTVLLFLSNKKYPTLNDITLTLNALNGLMIVNNGYNANKIYFNVDSIASDIERCYDKASLADKIILDRKYNEVVDIMSLDKNFHKVLSKVRKK